ncbi:unnamed protein product [Rotaria sp. Silwood1]|nr:unnamed protein product [Rotaria sp. Silwood1]CAF4823680.1 unnamed protein product [Rotaria sp. Silwood1]
MFHQQFYSQSQQQQQQQQTVFHNNHGPNHFYMPNNSSYYHSGPIPNQSSHHVNFSRIFEYFPMPSHGFTSMGTAPYIFNDITNQQQWKSNMTRNHHYHHHQQQYHRIPAYYFQDKSTYYYMSEPMITSNNRITIQLTKVHIGKNGDQQRVFVEQEFSNQNELRKFFKNLKYNFEKTFNNRTTNIHNSNETIHDNQHMNNNNNKQSGVIVIEEPDEEPKIYEQQVYNENINSKEKIQKINYPLVNISQTINDEQSTIISSCSTICVNQHRKTKKKYYQENYDNEINKKQNQKSSNYYHHHHHQQQQHYELPPRFQQQFLNKENFFRMTNDFDIHWKFNKFHNTPYNQPYSYVLPMNENLPPSTSSVFHHKKDSYYHSTTPSHFIHTQNQKQFQPSSSSSRRRRGKKHRRNQPKIIKENIILTNNTQQQTRVHRSRSNFQPQISFQNQIQTYQYLNYRYNSNQQHYIPYIPPSRIPIYYPQRRLYRNTQIYYRFVNSYRPNTIRF